MWDQEKEHKAKFEELVPKYRVRPTVLLPIWNVAGYVLGAGEHLNILNLLTMYSSSFIDFKIGKTKLFFSIYKEARPRATKIPLIEIKAHRVIGPYKVQS